MGFNNRGYVQQQRRVQSVPVSPSLTFKIDFMVAWNYAVSMQRAFR